MVFVAAFVVFLFVVVVELAAFEEFLFVVEFVVAVELVEKF